MQGLLSLIEKMGSPKHWRAKAHSAPLTAVVDGADWVDIAARAHPSTAGSQKQGAGGVCSARESFRCSGGSAAPAGPCDLETPARKVPTSRESERGWPRSQQRVRAWT